MNIICDLDGTIALNHKRNHFLHGNPECPKLFSLNLVDPHTATCICKSHQQDWKSYFDACDTDEPCRAVINTLSAFAGSTTIWILSGRSMSAHEKTLAWLDKYHVPFHRLQMRGQDDRTDDFTLKLHWAVTFDLNPNNTIFVLEDRTRVVDAWRAAGFRCFQVAPGNF